MKASPTRSSRLEDILLFQVKAAKLPIPVREARFHPVRKWRFDFLWADKKLAVECDGGTWTSGRHSTGKGYAADCEKTNAAQLMGYRVLRFTGDMVKSGDALKTLEAALA